MSENRGRRRLRAGAPGRVGEPNVLSNASTPNTLSGMAVRPSNVEANVKVPTGANVGTSPQVGSRQPAPGWLTTGATTQKQGFRLPSFGTVLFLGFLVVTGFRLIGQFAQGLAQETAAPTTPAEPPVQASDPGPIVFGSESDGDCGVLETALEFPQGTTVWWSAQLSSTQPPDVTVVIIVTRDGEEVEHQDVPPDPDGTKWSVLCSGAPVLERSPGLYRVEVWDETITVLHAAGEYTMTGA